MRLVQNPIELVFVVLPVPALMVPILGNSGLGLQDQYIVLLLLELHQNIPYDVEQQ